MWLSPSAGTGSIVGNMLDKYNIGAGGSLMGIGAGGSFALGNNVLGNNVMGGGSFFGFSGVCLCMIVVVRVPAHKHGRVRGTCCVCLCMFVCALVYTGPHQVCVVHAILCAQVRVHVRVHDDR